MADKTVLIYEKDDKFVKALKLYFRGSPWEPYSVERADELVPAASEHRPDAILLAIETDDGESRDLLRRLGSSEPTRHAPLVVMSSKKTDRDLFGDTVTAVGGHAYIKKPFIKKAIIQLLDDVLSGAPMGSSSSAPAARSRGGVDLGSVFSEADQLIDDFFPGGRPEGQQEGEFAISLDDAGTTAGHAPSGNTEPVPLSMDEESAPAPATGAGEAAMARPAAEEPLPYDAAELRRLRQRVRELEDELHQKSEEYKQVARDKEGIERSVGKKESELVDRIRGLEKQNEDFEEDIRKRKQHFAQMTATVQQLNDDLEEKDRKHAKELEVQQSQLSKLQSQFDELQEKASAQAHDIEDKTDEIARQRRRIEDLEAERNELQTNLERMTEVKEQGERTIESLERDLAQTRQTLASTEQDLATERGRIAAARETFERGFAGFRENLDRDLTEARERLEQGLTQVRETIEAGIARNREASERGVNAAKETLDKGIAQLLGQ